MERAKKMYGMAFFRWAFFLLVAWVVPISLSAKQSDIIQKMADDKMLERFVQDERHPFVVVFVHKVACPFCRRFSSTFDKLARRSTDRHVFFVTVDKELAPRLVADKAIGMFPTVVIYKRGRMYEQSGKRGIYQGCSKKSVQFFEREIDKVKRGREAPLELG